MANKPLTNTISENYKILKVVGQGHYGQVLHCFKQDTRENVAVKVLKKRHPQDLYLRELYILDNLRHLDPDKNNIVRYHEWFRKIDQTFMVFEMLDMNLYDYKCQTRAPLPLNGIRTIIKDVATALKALKGMGLIHTDIKLDNIMLVNHQKQPFRVKLIDFGLTMETREMWPGLTVQPLWNRAPEVIVGFPFNEAIDVWSLGAIMAEILLGFSLFPGSHEYDVLRFIVDVLGDLPKRLLNDGVNTPQYYYGRHKYFMLMYWTLKMPFQYFAETGIKPEDRRKYKFSSLDDLKTFNQHRENGEEAAERSACVELLKNMLQLDPKNRITPSKILEHDFILWSYLSLGNQCATELPPGVIMVRPAKKTMENKQTSAVKPQAVEDKKTDLPKDEDDSDCASTISDTVCNTCRIPRSPSLDSDIESIRLDSANNDAGTPDSINSPAPLEDSEPKKKKKKKGLRRFFSTLKRNLFSCFCVPKGNNE